MKANFIILIISLIGFISCEKVELRPKNITGIDGMTYSKDEFLKDGKGGLFKNVRWYEYDMSTHIIWPVFDVFAIKANNDTYKFQIINYYESSVAGRIIFQYSGRDGVIKKQFVDAEACGNPYTNPDYENCLKDPERNIFTYFRFSDLKTWTMNDEESLKDETWDMAFKGTDIKLNSGVTGPGVVSGALVHRFNNLFFDESGYAVLSKLQKKDNHLAAINSFSSIKMDGHYTYYLPEGIDRVIFENYWFQESSGIRQAITENWWTVRTHDLKYMDMHFTAINESAVNGQVETSVHLEYQSSNRLQASSEFNFSTQSKLLSQCLKMSTGEIYTCSKDRFDWDLKLTIVNVMRNGEWKREWRFFVNNGAIGPFFRSQK